MTTNKRKNMKIGKYLCQNSYYNNSNTKKMFKVMTSVGNQTTLLTEKQTKKISCQFQKSSKKAF